MSLHKGKQCDITPKNRTATDKDSGASRRSNSGDVRGRTVATSLSHGLDARIASHHFDIRLKTLA